MNAAFGRSVLRGGEAVDHRSLKQIPGTCRGISGENAMQEKIGKVILDYTWYSGRELYSDGDVEEHLLEIARDCKPEEYNAVIARELDWTVLYHFSHIRENITSVVGIRPTDSVLEIGAGCGAVTGALSEAAGEVTCIELSKRRSLINAYRHRNQDNIRILVGNFQDIETNLDRSYDVITLIGVFEYATSYISADSIEKAETLPGALPSSDPGNGTARDPYARYLEFLRLARRHLKPGGKLVIAIENRLGLKYWAGCREDHSGRYFDGLENYPVEGSARTFSRPELEELFYRSGFTGWSFYYPYPDYKLPMVIYSDDYLPKKGELQTNIWNFDRERILLFDEAKVYDSLVECGQYPMFSNSFLIVLPFRGAREASADPARVIYSRFSGERSPQFAIRTDILRMTGGKKVVRKSARTGAAGAHIRGLRRHAAQLEELFAGTNLQVNRILEPDPSAFSGAEADPNAEESVCLEYLEDKESLEEYLGRLIHGGEEDSARELLRRFTDQIRSRATEEFVITSEFAQTFGQIRWPWQEQSLPVTDIDMVPENILIDGPRGIWYLLDYEWTYEFPVPVSYVLYRIWHYFLAHTVLPSEEHRILIEEGFTDARIRLYREMEKAWQNYIAGSVVPIRELYAKMTPGVRDVRDEMHLQDQSAQSVYTTTFYYQAPGELSDENRSISTQLVVEPDGSFRLEVPLERMGYPASLRWDPIEYRACRLQLLRFEASAAVLAKPHNGIIRDGWDEFWTKDPVYVFYGDLGRTRHLVIHGRFELLRPEEYFEEINQTWEECKALRQEVKDLQNQIAVQSSTKAFRALELLRSFRNFVMARVRTIPGFRIYTSVVAGYQAWALAHQTKPEILEAQKKISLPLSPKFSILVPVFRTPETYLRAMIESVLAQTYGNWQLCIADASVAQDGSRDEKVRRILTEYQEKDDRICVSFLKQNGGISENTNLAAAMATGDYIMLLDHDDVLAPDALFEFACAIGTTGAQVLYSDEDKVSMDGTTYFDPNLKPDFSPDLLRSHNYITHLFCVKLELFLEVGGFRKEFDGAQDYDLIFRTTEKAGKICHIPRILYHWRMHPNSTAENPESKMYAYDHGRAAIDEHLRRMGYSGHAQIMDLWGMNHVIYDTPGEPLVSILIPNMDHIDDLDRCIRSILTVSDYRRLEILVIENNSRQQETFDYYKRITEECPQVRVVNWDGPFNYSAINNFGVSRARGDYLLLLNNDTELIEPGSIREMLGICMRSDVGCVGAKLLYADDTIQHAGIILGPGGFAGHVFHGLKKDDYGFMLRARIVCNYNAVTAACLMVSREKYLEINGLDESFVVALNDVDFCLRLRKKGYLVVFTPFSIWHHYESKSRGYEDTPEKKARFRGEIQKFRNRWGDLVDAGDEYYNPNFDPGKAPFTLY